MSSQQPVYPPQQPPKPYWTTAKIIALVLVVVVVASGSVAGLSYVAFRPASNSNASNLQCSNGTTNYPSCNSCVSPNILIAGRCGTCPQFQSYRGGACYISETEVFGNVRTPGSPYDVSFVWVGVDAPQNSHVATVTNVTPYPYSNEKTGLYDIWLLNQATYAVTIYYTTASGSSASCYVGNSIVSTDSLTYQLFFNC
jgi:hypothetical protein